MLFRNVTVVDGTGAEPYVAHVAVRDGRIAEIGPAAADAGGPVVDGDGLALAPGFIDMHAHSDLRLLAEPGHLAKVSQGVTCEVLGQDGLSYAPVDDTTLTQIRRQIAGWNGDPEGFDWNWRTVGEYLDRLDQGIAVNACYLVPQGSVRMLVIGWDDRPATAGEIAEQRRMVAEAMEQGAVGMSSGLTYSPGMYAGTDELVALCEVVGALGGFYAPHHRSYGAGALAGYAEMVEVSRRSGCPLHLAHATMNFEVNRGRAGELLALLDEAAAGGCDVSLDTYPYLPASTTLASLLPGWASEGGPSHALARLRDPATAERVRHAMEVEGCDGCHGVPVDWRTVQIAGTRTAALAARVGDRVRDFEDFRRLLIDDDLGPTILHHAGDEDNVQAIMRHPAHTGGSDGLLTGARPHPRAWGTFPRYLARYVRELGVLSLQECVAHLTARPARRLKLAGRGLIRSGYHADLVLFDPETVRDAATFDDPRRQAEGISHVLVAGVPVIEHGHPTGALPGRALRRTPHGTTAPRR
ncbi:N-acyl-D-amino-acid deacylase family protein [Sphaerisporangium dianthi]|uniref:Amidohydrolase family protein n=1 Tax=Sphaerisporangium dianthi TaxID=1436120 RepID=A0ABV9CSK3_9ACTN